MIELSESLAAVKPSATVAVTARVAELRKEGRDIIGLGAGEPDFDTPSHICEAAFKAIKDGKTRYTPVPGIIELREAIIEKFKRENQLSYTPGQITIGCGAKQLIYVGLMASLNKGDEVIIPAPYWVSYVDIVKLAQAKPVIITCEAEQGFKLTPEKLRTAITPQTKWLILNSPGNPSGEIYSRDELLSLAKLLEEYPRIHILSDDIYEHIRYGDEAFHTLASLAPSLYDRVLTINGLSKAYCMTGWRLGYAGGPEALITAMNIILSQSSTSPSTISQWAGIAALSGPQAFIEDHNKQFKKRRDMVCKALNDLEGIECRLPEGAFYLFPTCEGLIGRKTPQGQTLETDLDVVTFLLDNQGLATVHGEAFGLSPFFRISYATSEAVLEEACARLKKAVESLS